VAALKTAAGPQWKERRGARAIAAKTAKIPVATATRNQSSALREGFSSPAACRPSMRASHSLPKRRSAGIRAVRRLSSAFVPCRLRKKKQLADPQHHQEGAAYDFKVDGRTPAVQFSKNQNAPQQTPQLIRIGERNAPADAYVFGCVLLERRHRSPKQKRPASARKERRARSSVAPQRSQAEIADGESGHHAQFPNVKKVTNESGFIPVK